MQCTLLHALYYLCFGCFSIYFIPNKLHARPVEMVSLITRRWLGEGLHSLCLLPDPFKFINKNV